MVDFLYIPFISDEEPRGIDEGPLETLDEMYEFLTDALDPMIELAYYDVDCVMLEYDGVYIYNEAVAYLVKDHQIKAIYCDGVISRVSESKEFRK